MDHNVFSEIVPSSYASETRYAISDANPLRLLQSSLSPEDLERFVLDYLFFVKDYKHLAADTFQVGGTGDEGVDLYVRLNSGKIEYYQCKRYGRPLTKADFCQIITKILYYCWFEKKPVPNCINVVSMFQIQGTLIPLLAKPDDFLVDIKKNFRHYLTSCDISISDVDSSTFFPFLNALVFPSIISIYFNDLVDQFSKSSFSKLWFDVRTPMYRSLPRKDTGRRFSFESQLDQLPCENDQLKKEVKDDARFSFFSVLSLEETCHYLFNDGADFDLFIQEINESEKFHLLSGFSSIEEVSSELSNATHINTSSCYLDYRLSLIKNADRKGACHLLVEKGLGKWKK
jgi:hypothetical protein